MPAISLFVMKQEMMSLTRLCRINLIRYFILWHAFFSNKEVAFTVQRILDHVCLLYLDICALVTIKEKGKTRKWFPKLFHDKL